MTVGSVPPSLALGTVAPTQPGTAPVVPGAGTGAAGTAQPGVTQLPAGTTPQSGTPPQAAALTTALDALALKAAAQAALGEGGLALLMADLSQARSIPGLPAPVQAAINQILAQRAPLGVPPTIADLKAALTQSSASPATLLAASSSPNVTPVTAGPLANALLGLQQALKNWLANAPAPLASGPAPSAPALSAPSAAPGQAGAPPLLANLAQALRASGLPAPVQAAILQALTPLAAATVAALPTQSSAPLQAGLGGAAAPTTAANTAPVLADLAPASPAAVEQAPLAMPSGLPAQGPAATAPAVATPGAPLAATEPAIVVPTETSPALPSLALTSPAAPGAAPAAPETLATATPAAANALAATVLAGLPASVDSKAVMMIFQQVFKAWFDGTSTELSSTSAAPTSPQPATEIAGSGRSAPALPAQPSSAPSATNAPPPPYRGGPTTAQPAVPASLPANADPVTAGTRLLRETNAALAHQELLQIASLPAATQGAAPSSSQNPQWMFEIPFATAQGTAIAQFKITRDGSKGKDKGGKAPVWRANFSLDVEPMGPVHAQIVLSGERTWVSLWAEREESATRLRQNETLLTSSLKDSNFVAEVAFHTGAPRQTAATGRHFLNRAS